MNLKLIMHVDLSDNEVGTHHNVVACNTEDDEIDKLLEKLNDDASENDYYYVTEVDFEDY